MSSVFIFSGTSEGRILSEKLSDRGVLCDVFVATDYGEQVMTESQLCDIHVGRLCEDDIYIKLCESNPLYVIDATHPHAVEVSCNIKSACNKAGMSQRYIRVSRYIDNQFSSDSEDVVQLNSYEKVIEYLDETDGNILLTTGVKELQLFTGHESLSDRIIARILPGIESISVAEKLGIPKKHIIAMEGPFSVEMNQALIRQYDAKVLVTKNSGDRGGFLEKISAAEKEGIKVLVVNPEGDLCEDTGITVDEALQMVCRDNPRQIYLVGTGVCNEAYLSYRARTTIEKANLIIGAKRLLDFASSINDGADTVCEYAKEKVVEAVKSHIEKDRVVVLFSGDTGFFSGANGVYESIKKEFPEDKVEIIPGISSLAYFASKIGRPYNGCGLYSMHGKELDYKEIIDSHNDFYCICTGKDDVSKVWKYYSDLKPSGEMAVGFNLGSNDEWTGFINEKSVYAYYENLPDGLYIFACFFEKDNE